MRCVAFAAVDGAPSGIYCNHGDSDSDAGADMHVCGGGGSEHSHSAGMAELEELGVLDELDDGMLPEEDGTGEP